MTQEEKVVEELVVETKQEETTEQKEATEKQPADNQKVNRDYVEKKEDGTIKLDLNKLKTFQENAVQEQSTNEVPLRDESKSSEKIQTENVEKENEEITGESKKEETPVIEEIKDSENKLDTTNETKEIVDAKPVESIPEKEEVLPQKETQQLPENIQSVVKFMKETGGSLEDYVRLNADYSNVDENTLLREYYKSTKPHLNYEEISFLMEDDFSFDEEVDEPRVIKKKKLARKEEIAKAKKFLGGLKDQYYKEVKLTSKLDPKQKEAIDFYNTYNQEQTKIVENQKQQQQHFLNETNKVFNDNFKGFDFTVGNKKYRYNIKDVDSVKKYQSDIVNFVNEFVDDKQLINNAPGYHKALYSARNIDKIVNHFYEQGKADAIKETAIQAKNVDMSPRTAPVVEANGIKFRVLSGDDNSRLRFKIKK
jgi:hypothetical protein|tara:strand:- start:5349 stop:6620 length:1272 start_codon:yes stop_codon:yes gene_type:complete